MDFNCDTFTDTSSIKKVFVDFYLKLCTNLSHSSFSDILNALPSDLHTILDNGCDFLICDISKDEIFQTLLSPPSG